MPVLAHELTLDLALRIGLASRELAPLSPGVLIDRLQALCNGQLPDRQQMQNITPCQLRSALQKDAEGLTGKKVKSALYWLTDWEPGADELPHHPAEKIAKHPPFGVVRVAMASMGHAQLDGHFASCSRFMVYDVTPERVRLVAERLVTTDTEGGDKVDARLSLLRDCRILVVTGIGGPAAARVTRKGVLPLRVTDGTTATLWLDNLRRVLAGTPPPWLQRSMAGVDTAGVCC